MLSYLKFCCWGRRPKHYRYWELIYVVAIGEALKMICCGVKIPELTPKTITRL